MGGSKILTVRFTVGELPPQRTVCTGLRLTRSSPSDNVWYIPDSRDQKEVVMIEVFVGVALLGWTVLVLLATGDETV